MRRAVLLAALVVWPARPVLAVGPCTEIAEITSTLNDGVGTGLCATPATFCGALFIASEGTNGWCEVYDSPTETDPRHGQARRLAEPGAASQYNSAAWPLNPGHPTRFGLGAVSVRGRCYVQYRCGM